MALNEAYERRLTALVALIGESLDRVERLLRNQNSSGKDQARQITSEQIHQVHQKAETIRKRLAEAIEHFRLRPQRPELRQVAAGELSQLWVMLENARPEKMKGYGIELAHSDRQQWDSLIQQLLI